MVKFLIIRFSSIGDIVLTTPVIRGLKQQVENSEVHFLVKKPFARVLEGNPYIDKIHIAGVTHLATIQELKKEGYDYIIDLQNNARSGRIKRSLRRMYFTLDKLNRKKWLYTNFKINRLPDKHIVDRCLETCRLFDVNDDGKGLDFFIPEKEKLDPPFKEAYIVVVLGANHNTKRLKQEQYVMLLKGIKKPIILIGGKDVEAEAQTIAAENSPQTLFNGVGKWSIAQSASIIDQAQLIITPDTGMMHIAAALHKPIYSIWGNTVPEFGMYPYKAHPDSKMFEVRDLKCRPCSKIGHSKCPKKHFKCMEEQDLDQLTTLVNLYKS